MIGSCAQVDVDALNAAVRLGYEANDITAALKCHSCTKVRPTPSSVVCHTSRIALPLYSLLARVAPQ